MWLEKIECGVRKVPARAMRVTTFKNRSFDTVEQAVAVVVRRSLKLDCKAYIEVSPKLKAPSSTN